MRVVVFLASLFFMLLGGRIDSFAGVKVKNNYSAASSNHHVELKEPLVVPFTHAGPASIQKTAVPEDNKLYNCAITEEEDDNQSSSRKCQPVSVFFPGFPYQSEVTFRYNCYHEIPFFYLQASPRYIFQRTLRI
jgi:hypothetical protein